jgi:hypothetical protein
MTKTIEKNIEFDRTVQLRGGNINIKPWGWVKQKKLITEIAFIARDIVGFWNRQMQDEAAVNVLLGDMDRLERLLVESCENGAADLEKIIDIGDTVDLALVIIEVNRVRESFLKAADSNKMKTLAP